MLALSGTHDGAASTALPRRATVRILLFYDMEGASGVLSAATMDPERPESFAVGRQSVIDDVNAVIGGLFDGGATTVDVQNAHGAGGDSLVPRDRLDTRAGMLRGKQQLHPYAMGAFPVPPGDSGVPRPPYDAVVTVAMHDKPLSGGFMPHVIGMGITPIIDGRGVTETELVGYNFGGVGIPVIFSSGDDRLRATLATAMPWLEYAVVKRVTTPTVVAPLPKEQVRQALHDGAARAVRGLGRPDHVRVMTLPAEFRAGLLPSYPLFLPPGVGNFPGFQRRGDTTTFLAKDYRTAFWGMFALQRIARAHSMERTFLELANSPDSAVYRRARDSVWARADAFEAGKWRPR